MRKNDEYRLAKAMNYFKKDINIIKERFKLSAYTPISKAMKGFQKDTRIIKEMFQLSAYTICIKIQRSGFDHNFIIF